MQYFAIFPRAALEFVVSPVGDGATEEGSAALTHEATVVSVEIHSYFINYNSPCFSATL